MTSALPFTDSYKNKGNREKLVQLLNKKGITDAEVLKAFRMVPRHFFIESAFEERAYEDCTFPIGEGQTISQPYTVAYQTQYLDVKPGMKVLEIGTGSGFQCAILCMMGANVYSIERSKPLHERAKQILSYIGLKPRLKYGDGTIGWSAHQPFDRIIVTAGAPTLPQTLISQLAIGGKMIIPVGNMEGQTMILIQRISDSEYREKKLDAFRFVPLIGEKGWNI
jgi:protein-L-isoaspartate(D-aspartate) O-methyltransferase